jgi:hypothetical protein
MTLGILRACHVSWLHQDWSSNPTKICRKHKHCHFIFLTDLQSFNPLVSFIFLGSKSIEHEPLSYYSESFCAIVDKKFQNRLQEYEVQISVLISTFFLFCCSSLLQHKHLLWAAFTFTASPIVLLPPTVMLIVSSTLLLILISTFYSLAGTNMRSMFYSLAGTNMISMF